MQQFFSLLSWRLFTAQYVSGIFPPIIRSSMTALAASGFTFVSWWQYDCHHDTKIKPEAASAVIELLMMGGKTPDTRWAVNKRQGNKLKKLLHQVGDLFELNVKLRCQKVKGHEGTKRSRYDQFYNEVVRLCVLDSRIIKITGLVLEVIAW